MKLYDFTSRTKLPRGHKLGSPTIGRVVPLENHTKPTNYFHIFLIIRKNCLLDCTDMNIQHFVYEYQIYLSVRSLMTEAGDEPNI